jgi:glucose-fructose oxidoreductase
MTPSVFPNILIPKIKDKLGIALVGLGYYSTDVLAPAFKFTKHCELKGIVTGTPSKAENWQKKHNLPVKNIYNYENFDTIANNPEIDVIYVVLPPSMHAEYSIRAAKAGKQVWCEKPMAPSVKECEEMIKACKDNKVSLAIGYRMQHEANTKQMMQWRKAGKFGKIKTVNVGAGYFDGRTDHWKMKKVMGGGAMYDMGVYSLQGARYSVGEEPVAVISAKHTTNRPDIFKEVDETTAFKLEFPGGAIADCETSFGKSINFLDVKGSKGWFKLEPFQAYSGVQGNSSVGMLKLPMGNQQATQMDDDVQYIKAKKTLIAPGEEGLRDIRVVEKIYESARTGKRVVI